MSNQERFKLPVGVFVMFRQGKKVLLQLRQNGLFSGMWGFVGGHLDGGEKIARATIREAKEEVGVDVLPGNLILKTVCHSNKGAEYLQFYYECHSWSGEFENKEPDKCVRLEWFDWDNLPPNTCPYLKPAVAQIDAGSLFFENEF